MNFLVDVNLGWNKIIVGAKDFVTLSEIIERATVADKRWLDSGETVAIRVLRPSPISADAFTGRVLSQEEYDAIRAREKVLADLKAEAEAPQDKQEEEEEVA